MKNKQMPEIRFEGFSEKWDKVKAADIFRSVSDKDHSNLPVLSATQEKGMVYRDDVGIDIQYNKKSTKNYKRVLPNQFVIHLRSFQGGFAFSKIEGITSPAYTVLDFQNKENHYPLFWKYFLASNSFIKRLESVTYGIRDGRSISFRDFSTLSLQIPSYHEQLKIGDFFNRVDDAINIRQQELDTLKQTKQGFLQKMFPKKGESVPEIRFPEFSGDWEQKTLSDEVEVIGTGKSKFKSNIEKSDDTSYAVLGSTGVIGYDSQFDYSGKFILTARVGANAGNLYTYSGNVKISDNTVYIQGEQSIFIYYLLSRFNVKRLSFGTGQPLVKASELKKLKLMFPKEKAEQTKIGAFFKQLDDTIALHEIELETLKQTKKAFLQKMFV